MKEEKEGLIKQIVLERNKVLRKETQEDENNMKTKLLKIEKEINSTTNSIIGIGRKHARQKSAQFYGSNKNTMKKLNIEANKNERFMEGSAENSHNKF